VNLRDEKRESVVQYFGYAATMAHLAE